MVTNSQSITFINVSGNNIVSLIHVPLEISVSGIAASDVRWILDGGGTLKPNPSDNLKALFISPVDFVDSVKIIAKSISNTIISDSIIIRSMNRTNNCAEVYFESYPDSFPSQSHYRTKLRIPQNKKVFIFPINNDAR